MSLTRSKTLFEEAKSIFVGGVNSPVRAFKSVGGTPRFIDHASGAYVTDADGRQYIDYVLSWGPMILGHADPRVTAAAKRAIDQGTSFGAPTEAESRLGQKIRTFYPVLERMRFVNSGTEACMSALRLARGVTKKSKIIKFNGCYHGHADSLLVAAGSGGLTLGQPDSLGVLPDFAKHTLVADFNDIAGLEALFQAHGDDIACIILEPIAGNMGMILPDPGFLEACRRLCDAHEAILIFDEVMVGFRIHDQGISGAYGVTPDLVCLGKVVGGGFPCAVYGGRADIMDALAPKGGVYQAGTLSGNPVAMAAGTATLSALEAGHALATMTSYVEQLITELKTIVQSLSLPVQFAHRGSMFSIFFTDQPVRSLADVQRCDFSCFRAFFHFCLQEGVYLAPSQYEANFLSAAHSEMDLRQTVSVMKSFFERLSNGAINFENREG